MEISTGWLPHCSRHKIKMAFPTGWNRKCALTIDHTKVSADQANFPVLFTVSNLPSEMFDADGSYPANADGGDISFSSDSAGATQLPVEVVSFTRNNDPALGKAEVHVKVTSVSSTVDTVVYVWYNNSSATMPARTNTYGSDNVWDSNFKFVCHNGASINDSTSGALTGTNHSTTEDATVTLIGTSSRKFVAASTQYIDWGNTVNINGDVDLTIEAITRFASLAEGFQFIFGRGDNQYILTKHASTIIQFQIYDTGWQVNVYPSPVIDTWYHFTGRRTASTNSDKFFVNSTVIVDSITSTTIASSSQYLQEGSNYSAASRYLNGWIEETRISDLARSDSWVAATYNTINSPSTFVTEGTPESLSTNITSMRVIWFS